MSRKNTTIVSEKPESEAKVKVELEYIECALNPLLSGPLREPVPQGGSVAIGRVVAVDESGPSVSLTGIGVRRARALCALPAEWADRECAVLFENGDLERPLIVGLLMTGASELSEAAPPAEPEPEALPESERRPDREVVIDGERLVLTADTELELRCGESVILLQRDGRIEIRGNYITSQATATQRMRGGSIHMN